MIQLIDIEKRFHGRAVLQKASLTVQKGEVAVLLGPSGGGKSTLLRTINGLETFDGGQIQVAELILTATESTRERERTLSEIRKRVGMVFQQFHLFPHLTVLQNVMEAPVQVLGKRPKDVRDQARQLLDRVGLLDKEQMFPDRLSGGQQQRVAIARTLAMEPEVILFDEPTSALDPQMTAEVIRVMTELARGGQTMIVVTHAMEFARTVADSVHVLYEGSIIESGSPLQVFQQPREQVTQQFLNAVK